MGRGVSSGGGRSSLGYLFGSGEAPKPAENAAAAAAPAPVQKPASPPLVDASKQIPAGIQGCQANNYFRADGQNSGNFITFKFIPIDGLFRSPPVQTHCVMQESLNLC